MKQTRPEVLEIVPHYLPGYKAGGPIRTVSTTVARLSGDFRFRILTSDRDVGDDRPYPDVTRDRWLERGAADVMYLSPRKQNLSGMRRILSSVEPDLVHVNGFYHPAFTLGPLLLRRLGLLEKAPLLLAPRGHLSPGARSLKPWRKRAYIGVVNLFGLTRDVVLHASEDLERREIFRVFPDADVRVAADPTPAQVTQTGYPDIADQGEVGVAPLRKRPGELKALFLSRIVPKKNLAGLLEALSGVEGHVELSVVGPIGDEAYWEKCQGRIYELPESIMVNYRGAVPPDQVLDVMREHHLFVLPTHSENFGHVIHEALEVGRPILISDQTPWEGVEQASAGWICDVENTSCFRERVERAIRMDQGIFEAMCEAARRYVLRVLEDRSAAERTIDLFREMVNEAGR